MLNPPIYSSFWIGIPFGVLLGIVVLLFLDPRIWRKPGE